MPFQKLLSKEKNIFSTGTKIIIFTMAIDFFAWGFIDPFFSMYARSVIENLFLIGLLVAVKGLSGLVFLSPLSETIHVKSPRAVGFIGRFGCAGAITLYLFGGIEQIPAILFLGAVLHGFSGTARDISTREYLMEASSKKNASTILGANFSLKSTAWMVGSILSGYLLMYLTMRTGFSITQVIPIIFFLMIPLFFLSAFFIKKIPVKKEKKPFPFYAFCPKAIIRNEKKIFSRFFRLNLQLKFSMFLICFLQIIRSSLLLFLPLLAFKLELSVGQIGLLMASMHAPLLLSAFFSIFEDRTDRMLFIIGGLLFSVIPLLLLSQVSAPFLVGISAVLTSLSLAIIMPANLGTIAANTKNEDAPQVAALQIMFQRFGMLFGALMIGSVSQIFGISSAFLLIAILAITFAVFALIVRFQFRVEKKVSLHHHSFHVHPLHPHLFHIHDPH